ncbi:MAG: hypothetical protein ACREXR_04415, partial [Gammaproteobacteria bacterium]
IWHTLRREDGSWHGFGDIKSLTGNPGPFTAVGCGGVNRELHVCGITRDGSIWHTLRREDGSWHGFGDIKSLTGNPGPFTAVGCAGASTRVKNHVIQAFAPFTAQAEWDLAVNHQMGIIGSDFRGVEEIGSAAFERAAASIVPNFINFWYPQKQPRDQRRIVYF